MTYVCADPDDPPMVMVLVDDERHHAHVIAQELVDDAWHAHVQFSTERSNRLGTFTGDKIRPDTTDHSRGRSAKSPTGDLAAT